MKYPFLIVFISTVLTLAANITALVMYDQRIQMLERQTSYLVEQDELSRPFVDKDGNHRGTDGNFITEIADGFSASTSMYIPHEAVMQMRREAKEAKKKEAQP